ncbi:DNA cytosine methyltransferase [Actinomyces gaoshouyii]|uniref:DNA cytosine methyltransferase n=1 Tax=Actinomyces gaoshouyii TaxID=1960083 RepID=UPI0009BE35B4|nr:DNA cytosine methyltransferase [Actinomyces gaoshouyii]ARD42485.1 DNA methyltransferase [Actinomyces gaoshouyii]
MSLTITDLFCGAGGSSSGAVQVPSTQVVMAANHWRLAVDTHQANHPGTDHDCADLSQVDPRRYPATDVLWASPECTNHSLAQGVSRLRQAEARRTDLLGLLEAGAVLPDDAAMRSRATMWDVVRFTEHHRYRAVIVENVVEAASWVLFPAWRAALGALGYELRLVCLNSMHAHQHGLPAPQSRDRLYVVAWRRGERAPDLEQVVRPWAWCPDHGWVRAMQAFKRPDQHVGRYRSQYVYRCPQVECRNRVIEPPTVPAASIIDWTDPGVRIGDRKRPLADKTLRRIRVGIERYWCGQWAPALAVPVEGRGGKTPDTVAQVLRTQTTRRETALAMAPQHASPSKGWALHPFIAELRGGGSCVRAVSDPLATVTASGNHHGLVTSYYGTSSSAAPTSDPPATVTTRDRHGLVTAPARTITTAGHQSLLTGQTIEVDDVHFRMLTPGEITAAMAFPSGYRILGTKKEQVRQAGNAVTPPAARDLIAAVVEAVTS